MRYTSKIGKKNSHSILSHVALKKKAQLKTQYYPGQQRTGGIAAKTAEIVSEKMRHEYIIDLKRGASANKQRTIDQSDAFFAFD